MSRINRRILTAAATAVGLLALTAAPAPAALTVDKAGDTVTVVGGDDAEILLAGTFGFSGQVIVSANVPVTSSDPACSNFRPDGILCDPSGVTDLSIQTNGGDDSVNLDYVLRCCDQPHATLEADVVLGEGNDRVSVNNAGFVDKPLTVDAGAGNDSASGTGAADVYDMGAGNDFAGSAIPGSDSVSGGPDTDLVSVVSAGGGPVTAQIGAGGIGGDIENMTVGTRLGGNHLIGDDGPNSIFASEGIDGVPDVLEGRGGDDRLTGQLLDDQLLGGAGDDVLGTGFSQPPGPVTGSFDGGSHGAAGDTLSLDFFPAAMLINLDGTGGRIGRPDDEIAFPGIEHVIGTPHDDTINGSDADNQINGRGGNDSMSGGDGDGDGADDFTGDTGEDSVSYFVASTPVRVELDDAPGDGALSEGDNVRSSVENLTGGRFGDVLRSPASSVTANVFSGVEGADTIDGGGGGDDLLGSFGDDEVRGEGGDDRVNGGPGEDELEGGTGADTLTGEAGNDTADGGADDDEVDGGPGEDVLDGGLGGDELRSSGDGAIDVDRCGDGLDAVIADPFDLLDGCEERTIVEPSPDGGGGGDTPPPAAPAAPLPPSTPAAPAPGPPEPTTITVAVSLSSRTITATRGGVVVLTVTCPPDAEGGCAGFVALATANSIPVAVVARRKRKVVALGRARFRAGPGQSVRVRVKLTRRGRKALRRLRRLRVKVTATPTGARGETPVRLGTVVVRAPRRR